MSDILPCPFCGRAASDTGKTTYSSPTASNATWSDGTPIMVAYFCNCLSCGVSNKGIAGGYRTQDEARSAWNRRVPIESRQASNHQASGRSSAAPVVGCEQSNGENNHV
jgi:hypothetical protein